MKSISTKAVVVLTVISLIVMVLLAGINTLTKDKIAENDRLAILDSLAKINESAELAGKAPVENYDNLEDALKALPEELQKSIVAVFHDRVNDGYAFIFQATSSFSSAPMKYTVYIDSEGRIVAFTQIDYMESKNFGASFPSNFHGKNEAETEAFNVADLKTGATYSAKAFKKGLSAVFDAYAIISENN